MKVKTCYDCEYCELVATKDADNVPCCTKFNRWIHINGLQCRVCAHIN